ncbi:MAG: hypothetical protein A3J55_00655 [Candidatus Ryanbacteria bacterium RIFCSPHIGHO2_02_FULL_45_17b]|uniref:t-SNARE coiled-coil homology domain-containing protein n=1 Tax=Candidatus Ryanbacteria bacterium RIFCSPHIGHO2_01_FULL_45_22 TaxID=1802114 RepID=A0A1G2G294_9BACT|nr:MAG: hypothetical protein A2719_03120 [Candidatus Ryanbacteria bacterium RIFCSPHIGHO2_01_FULL_45_22]OGZ47053.1 MAG: hypothetical protein A3J55_00655 [Candidatus Ryanbacteria bacterium RIFCSPHIGHO2_02_FULL_45_17b]
MVKKVTNEELARMIAKGFENTATKDDIKRLDGRMDTLDDRMDTLDGRMDHFEERMDRFEERMDRFDGRMDHMDARLGRIEADVAEIRGNLVYKDEFEDLMARVKYLEIKAGIDSGK